MRTLTIALILVPLFIVPVLLQAQEQTAQASGPPVGAQAEALARFGTIDDLESDLQVISNVVVVKLSSGSVAGSPPEAVRAAAVAVGLHPGNATHLPMLRTPLDEKVATRLQRMSPERRRRAEQAEEELRRIVELRYEDDLHPRLAALKLAQLPSVEYAEAVPVEPNVLGAPAPNDPLVSKQKHLEQIQAFDAWEIWPGDTNTVIGIVDDGIDMFHEDLAGNIKENPGEAGVDGDGNDKQTNGLDDDGNGVVDDWRGANLTADLDGTTPGNTKGNTHGTSVAGLAAATTNNELGIAGAANLCRFFPIKAGVVNGGLARAYEGILYAARRGFPVINCSWGIGGEAYYSLYREDLIANTVLAYDVAVVAAGGNDEKYERYFPAAYPHVLGVGAVDSEDKSGSTWGEQVDVSAPVGWTTLENNRYNGSEVVTSFSTPVASGVLALIRSRYPDLSAEQAIAHMRLTCDRVDDQQEGQRKGLVGYGRINALRALSTDPFSHPAVVIDSIWLEDENGVPREFFSVGEKGRLRLRVRNLLGEAADLKVNIVPYTGDSTLVRIDGTPVDIGTLGRESVATPGEGIPFEVRLPYDGRIRIRFEFRGGGGYEDYQYERQLFYRPYTVVNTPRITASLGVNGSLGFADFPSNVLGEGVQYGGRQLFYEGGFIIAPAIGRLEDNVRDDQGSGKQPGFVMIEAPSESNDYTVTLSDRDVESWRRLHVQMRLRLKTIDTVENAFGLEMRLKNNGTETFEDMHVAFFADWDLSAQDQVNLVEEPGRAVPFHGMVSSDDNLFLATGIAGPAAQPIFYANLNNVEPVRIYGGFDQLEKWEVVDQEIGPQSAGPGDISVVVGKTLERLEPGAEDTTLIIIGIGTSAADAADGMHRFFPGSTSSAVPDIVQDQTMLSLSPNPVRRYTTITVGALRPGAVLGIYDVSGRLVHDLTPELAHGITGLSLIFDGSGLPSGFYYVRLRNGDRTEAHRMLLLK